MLRCHFNEKSAAELFQSLSTCCQRPDETADEYLMRVYEIRQKLVFAKSENGVNTVPYDNTLIQNIFINTIETGLRNEAIRNKIRPYLRLPRIGETEQDFEHHNDDLLAQLSLATSTEIERDAKLKNVVRKTMTAASVSTEEDARNNSTEKKKHQEQKQETQVVAMLQTMQKQLGSLTQEVNELKALDETNSYQNNSYRNNSDRSDETNNAYQNTYRNNSDRWNNSVRRRPQCKQCIIDKVELCSHCFRCGSTEHFARGCKKKAEN
jgi:hypothetical protein